MASQQQMLDSMQPSTQNSKLVNLQKELALKKQREEYSLRVSELADKIVKYSQSQSPVSAQMVEVLVPFLEVTMVMEGIIDTMTELDSVMGLIGNAMNILDQTMESSQQIMASTMGIKYTWLRRLKRKIMMAKAKANNRARAKAICEQVTDFYEMAHEMRSIFGTIPAEMSRAIEKMNGRKQRGNGGTPTPYEMSPGVRDLLASKGAKFDNLGYTAEGNAPVPAPSAGGDGIGIIFTRSPHSTYSEDL